MKIDKFVLAAAARYIFVDNVQHLAINYLGFTPSEMGSLSKCDAYVILSKYCKKKKFGAKELSIILERAGIEDGLVGRTAIDILRGMKGF